MLRPNDWLDAELCLERLERYARGGTPSVTFVRETLRLRLLRLLRAPWELRGLGPPESKPTLSSRSAASCEPSGSGSVIIPGSSSSSCSSSPSPSNAFYNRHQCPPLRSIRTLAAGPNVCSPAPPLYVLDRARPTCPWMLTNPRSNVLRRQHRPTRQLVRSEDSNAPSCCDVASARHVHPGEAE